MSDESAVRVFTNSLTCKSGAHCKTCRDPEADVFRSRVVGVRKFDCPHGRPWGYLQGMPVEGAFANKDAGGCCSPPEKPD